MEQRGILSTLLFLNVKQNKNNGKTLKLEIFESSFIQSDHIYRRVQEEMMDNISTNSVSHNNFLVFFNSS